MSEKLGHILKRMNSIFLAKLWAFYREYFQNDNECLDFLYSTLKNTPEETVENSDIPEETKAPDMSAMAGMGGMGGMM